MGKKAKRKPHKGSVQRPKKPLQNALHMVDKIEGNELELGQSGKFCKHLDKGIHLGELESQIEKSSVLQCQGCLRGSSGKKSKKGKVKHVKKKGGFKDTNKVIDFPKGRILVCLACGHMGCGGDENGPSSSGHAWQHWLQAHHANAVQCNDNGSLVLWCFLCKGSVQDNSVVEGEESCQSLQLQALKLVEEKLINLYVNETSVGEDDVVGDSEKVGFQNPETSDGRVRSTRHIVRGLRNLGNTCFFNSVVQNLLALDVLRDHFMNSGQYVEGPMTLALRKLYFETSSEEMGQGDGFGPKMGMNVNGIINPRALFDAVCDSSPQFRGYQQQDSHELWQFLLNSLRTEESNARKSIGNTSSASLDANSGDCEAFEGNRREYPNNVTNTSDSVTLLEHVFEGQLCSTILCCKCGHSSVTYETFYDLQLPIPRENTGKKVLFLLSKDSSSPKAKWKKNAITSKHRHNAGKWISGMGDLQSQGNVDVQSQVNVDVPSPEISLPGAQDSTPSTEEIAENPCVLQETTEWNRTDTQEDCGWNAYAPQEDNGWNGYAPQEDNVWMDYLVSGTEVDDILYENLLDTSENGQQVDSNYAGNINNEWNFTMTDSSEMEPPLPVLGDSEILLLPYKEVDPIVGEQLLAKGDSVDLPQDDIKDALANHLDVDVSSIDPEAFDGFGQLFEEEEETTPAKKPEEGECDSFLYDENVNDFLDTESFVITSEAKEEEIEAPVTPMSLDGCLVDFTKLETLTEENAYRCEICSARVVASSDKQEKRAAKADKGMRSKNTSVVGSSCAVSDASSTCGKEDDVDTLGKSNLLSEVRDTELQVLDSARSSGASAMEAENPDVSSGGTRCSGNRESKKCDDQGLNEADQGVYEEVHKIETSVADCVTVNISDDIVLNDSLGELASCSYTDICSNENLSRNFGSEFREETDGATETEWSLSASLSSKGKESDENSKGYALRPRKQLSTGKGYVLDKRKSKKTEFNPNAVKYEATKRYFISKAPSVLVIHLKRFTQDLRGRLSKLGGHVTFQERLDLRPFLDPRRPDKDNCIYHLNGVVEHLGTMRSGHYVAYVRCHEDENCNNVKGDDHPDRSPWYYVSDSDVRRISFSKVLQCEAYLLFYEKCRSF